MRLQTDVEPVRRPRGVLDAIEFGQGRHQGRGWRIGHARSADHPLTERPIQQPAVGRGRIERARELQRAVDGREGAALARVGPGACGGEGGAQAQFGRGGEGGERGAGVGEPHAFGVHRAVHRVQPGSPYRQRAVGEAGGNGPGHGFRGVGGVELDLVLPRVDTDLARVAGVPVRVEQAGQRQCMTAPQRVLLARCLQLLQRERARRSQQPIARLGLIGVAHHRHQRAIDQAGEGVQNAPFVEAWRIGHHALDHGQRRAACEHRQAAEHGLLALVEQAVAPFHGRAQRLVACRRGAVAAGGQQLQAILHRRGEPLHAEHRHARGGKLDRQCQAIERGAQRDHGGRVGVGEREARVGGLCPFGEQCHGAEG